MPFVNPISTAASAAAASAENHAAGAAGSAQGAAPFSDLLMDAAGQVDHLQTEADAAMTGLMAGTGIEVHSAMIAAQKASMAFELTLAVRNKAVQAYQQVMSMQF